MQILDNRPAYLREAGDAPSAQSSSHDPTTTTEGDVLFVQPAHLTSNSASSSSAAFGAPIQPDISDLEAQAETAIQEGRAPRWDIEDDTTSMRSSLRIGNVSFDLSWHEGAGPPTLPPTIPIAPNVIFSARGTGAGALEPPCKTKPFDILRHEPAIVAYKTLSSPWSAGPTLSPGYSSRSTTPSANGSPRQDSSSAAGTPRFWLVIVGAAPAEATGELPLQAGE